MESLILLPTISVNQSFFSVKAVFGRSSISSTTPMISTATTSLRLRRGPASICSASQKSTPVSCEDNIKVFDTTLCNMKLGTDCATNMIPAKIEEEIALQITRLGVDIIEVGCPAVREQFDLVKHIAETVGAGIEPSMDIPVVCARTGCEQKNIEIAWRAIKGAKHPRLNLFLPILPLEYDSLQPEQGFSYVEKAFRMVRFARGLNCPEVQLSLDYNGSGQSKTVYNIAKEAIEARADIISIHWVDDLNLDLLKDIKNLQTKGKRFALSCRCGQGHFGSGAKQLVKAVKLGATQVEISVNGTGGVVSLQEFQDELRRQ